MTPYSWPRPRGAAADLGLKWVPRLSRHPHAVVPHLWGLGRFVVVLPDGPLPPADLVAVLRHEFAHAAQRRPDRPAHRSGHRRVVVEPPARVGGRAGS